jgi:PKD repeat protein
MKTLNFARLSRSFTLCCALCLAGWSQARAGLSLQLDIIHDDSGHVLTCSPNLGTDGLPPDGTPVTYDQVNSPGTNFAGGLGTGANYVRLNYPDNDFDGFLSALTNGVWQLIVNAGATNEQTYSFTVSNVNLDSNALGAAVVTFPTNGAVLTSDLPDFAWQGPTGWGSLLLYLVSPTNANFFQYIYLSPALTNGTVPPVLAPGSYGFTADYTLDVSQSLLIGTPLDSSNNPPADWAASAIVDVSASTSFSVEVATLGQALDQPNLIWTTSGEGTWFPETTNTADGISAAQSAPINNNQNATLETTITGPAYITFNWQVVADDNDFHLFFYVDGAIEEELNGAQSWTAAGPFTVGAGAHDLQWVAFVYPADAESTTNDAAFLGDVVVAPIPTLAVTATPTTGPAPLRVQFTSPGVDSAGNLVTNWNWDFGDGATSTAQSPSHTYTNIAGYYPSLAARSAGIPVPPTVTGLGIVSATVSPATVAANLPGPMTCFVYNDFKSPGSLQFNGAAAVANTSDGAVLELTPSAGGLAGSAFTATAIPLAANDAFATFFTFRLSHPGPASADGISFTIQSESPFGLGGKGGGIGYGACNGSPGISPAVSVEFDTFNDGSAYGQPGDINNNHVAVNVNGSLDDPLSVTASTNYLGDGNVWYAWIDYNGAARWLTVRLSETPVRPLAALLATQIDLPSILGSTNVYVGFTGATGAGWEQQDVVSWFFMALPTTRITGHYTMANCSTNYTLTNGLAIKWFTYQVAGIAYTNIYGVQLEYTKEEDGSFDFESDLESSPLLPSELASLTPFQFRYADWANGNGPSTLSEAILQQYRDYLVGIGIVDGLQIEAGLGPSNAELAELLSHEEWSVSFEGASEDDLAYVLGNAYELEESGYAGVPQTLRSFYASVLQAEDPYTGEEEDLPADEEEDDDGYYDCVSVSCSTGQYRGTLVAREQIVLGPPWPLVAFKPRTVGTNFTFNFRTVLNQTYTVWSCTNLALGKWAACTNLTGDGYVDKVTMPTATPGSQFIRLSTP